MDNKNNYLIISIFKLFTSHFLSIISPKYHHLLNINYPLLFNTITSLLLVSFEFFLFMLFDFFCCYAFLLPSSGILFVQGNLSPSTITNSTFTRITSLYSNTNLRLRPLQCRLRCGIVSLFFYFLYPHH
jgi:hypothetical protein